MTKQKKQAARRWLALGASGALLYAYFRKKRQKQAAHLRKTIDLARTAYSAWAEIRGLTPIPSVDVDNQRPLVDAFLAACDLSEEKARVWLTSDRPLAEYPPSLRKSETAKHIGKRLSALVLARKRAWSGQDLSERELRLCRLALIELQAIGWEREQTGLTYSVWAARRNRLQRAEKPNTALRLEIKLAGLWF